MEKHGAKVWRPGAPLWIGVDIGGTNTDVVLMQGGSVLAWHKEATTPDITGGVVNGIQRTLRKFLRESEVVGLTYAGVASQIRRVCIGTTHFVNAVVERRRRDLAQVAVVRLCSDSSWGVPPFSDFPSDLARCMQAQPRPYFFARGGYEFTGQAMNPVDPVELRMIADDLRLNGNRHVVISSVFATLQGCAAHELEAQGIIREHFPGVSVTLSHTVGRMGLLERENAAILNESLRPLCRETIRAFGRALESLELRCPFYLTKNDGTLISASSARAFPVSTFASGPTNSMRGAYHLSGISDGVVIDIGGTTSDGGYLRNGYPRQASSEVKIAGVSVGYQMADTISIGLGGGSLVAMRPDGTAKVGPQSVGYQLTRPETGHAAIVFGGNTLTASDVAIAAGTADGMKKDIDKDGEVCDQRLASVDPATVQAACAVMQNAIADLIDIVKGSAGEVEVILVGGGSELVNTRQSQRPLGVARFVQPPCCEVANAVGAALGQISATIDRVYVASGRDAAEREAARAEQHRRFVTEARALCVEYGALEESVVVHPPVETAMSYMPGRNVQIHVLAVGDIDETREVMLGEEDFGDTDTDAADSATEDATATPTPSECSDPSQQPLCIEENQEDKILGSVPDFIPQCIDVATGDWTLNAYDVWCIVIGAGLLGCGGGGSPTLARIRALRALEQGAVIRIIKAERIGSCEELTGCVGCVAFMGAPTVVLEKLVAGHELRASVCGVQRLINREHHGDIEERANGRGLTEVVAGLDAVCDPANAAQTQAALCRRGEGERRMVALMPLEVGGLNCVEPLVIAAEMGVPVVDCDGMGRAFPEIQMFAPFIFGVSPCPCVLVAADGRWRACTAVNDVEQLEMFMRAAVGDFGCIAALSIGPLEREDLMTKCVPGSLTNSYKLGHAVLCARRENSDPVLAVKNAANAVVVARGKVLDVPVQVTDAFARGHVDVESFAAWDAARPCHRIDIQNEYICCRRLPRAADHRRRGEGNVELGAVVVTAPHLITILDNDTGFPITTEELRAGQRVAVVAIRAPTLLLDPLALPVVGPAHFMRAPEYGGITEPVFPAAE